MKRLLEAIGGGYQAGAAVTKDQRAADRAALTALLTQFRTLKQSLTNRLLDGVTDFGRFNLQALLSDVDRLIDETQTELQKAAAREIVAASERGTAAADQPAKAVGILVAPALPGLDTNLVTASFGNTVDLLTLPMKQFGADVKSGLRRVALAGDNKFEEIQALRDKISGAGLDNAQFRAERIIRTEVGRVFNYATFERMQTLAASFPFLKKGWRATKDSRTRVGHAEAGMTYVRGAGIAVADRFTVKVYDERQGKGGRLIGTCTLRFPLDPDAAPAGKIAAGATIMCRCNSFVDFSPAELMTFNRQRVALALGGVTPPPIVPPPPIPPDVVPVAKPVKPKAAKKPPAPRLPKPAPPVPTMNPNDPVQVRQALADLAAASPLTERIKFLTGEVARVTALIATLNAEISVVGRKLVDDYMKAQGMTGPDAWKNPNWSATYQAASTAKFNNPIYQAAVNAHTNARTELANHAAMVKSMREAIQGDALKLLATNPANRINLNITYAGKADQYRSVTIGLRSFQELVEAPGMYGTVTIKMGGGRGHYSLGTATVPDRIETVVHEMGHWLEDKVPGVHEQAVAFLVRRTAGETPTRLKTLAPGFNYNSTERATGDKFSNPYAGKWYTFRVPGIGRTINTFADLTKFVRASEVVSMGLQHLYEDPVGFAERDPDYFDFIFSLARQIKIEPLPMNAWDWNHVDGVKPQPNAQGIIPKLASVIATKKAKKGGS